MIGGLKLALIGSVVAFLAGSYAGYSVRDAYCDAAAGKAQTRHDARQHDARDAADNSERTLYPEQARELSQLENATDELRGQISSGVCFGIDDVDRLRRLWPGG